MGDWTARWKRACHAAEAPGLRFHDLRRTASRNLVRAGVDRKVARKVTGHLTDAMFDRYDILDDEDLRQAMPKYSAFLKRLNKGTGRALPTYAQPGIETNARDI